MKTLKIRIILLSCFVALIFSVCSYRLIDIQLMRHEELVQEAGKKFMYKEPISARRGNIFDASDEILAANIPAKRIIADTTVIAPKNVDAMTEVISQTLELPPEEVRQRLTNGRAYNVLKRQVLETTAADLRHQLAHLGLARGIREEDDAQRIYPNGDLLCHVIGFVNHDYQGIQGIERTMDASLKGTDGYRLIERDRKGGEIVIFRGREAPPQHGANVRLTVDMRLQHIVEQELDAAWEEYSPRSAMVVMMRPSTGEILAMANRPNFDLNFRQKVDEEHKKNRAITDMLEPGSTFKIVTAGAALNERIVTPQTVIYCENGRFYWKGKPLKDHRPYGNLTVEEMVIKSSNIGFAKLAIQMGEERLYDYIQRFGFGAKTGIELPGEIGGLVHHPSNWNKISITRIPMGHEICVTPLQLAVAVSTVANGGVMMKPRIVNSISGGDGITPQNFPPVRLREVISREAARQLKDAMVRVVEPGGTAMQAKVDFYKVAGKTGTAQRVDPKGGYTPGKYVVSFAGFMPADNPELAMVVILDDANTKPGMNYGGLVAAPIFSRIATRVARQLELPPSAEPASKTTTLAGVKRAN